MEPQPAYFSHCRRPPEAEQAGTVLPAEPTGAASEFCSKLVPYTLIHGSCTHYYDHSTISPVVSSAFRYGGVLITVELIMFVVTT